MALLAGEIGVGSGAVAPLVAAQRPTVVPLSFAQQRIWFLDQFQGPCPIYNIPLVLRLEGGLDTNALHTALADVVARHETLRTVFPAPNGIAHQHVLTTDQLHLSCEVIDARHWSTTQVTEAIDTRAGYVFDLATEIPLRASLFTVGDDEHVLVLVIHHIACDGWSLRPLLADLDVAYTARYAAHAPDWDQLAVHYIDYTLWQRDSLGELSDPDSAISAQLRYWEHELAGLAPWLQLPTDRPLPTGRRLPRRHRGGGLAGLVAPAADPGRPRPRHDRFHAGTNRPGGGAGPVNRKS